MTPATRRHSSIAAATRPPRAVRAGFTLVEMMVSVTLVLLMMLMFAEIYSLAQNTISTQRGIAENDQKARILSEVLRRDLATRTFRSVYPFRLEGDSEFAHSGSNKDRKEELIANRRGYFSYSENDIENDIDDVLQLTISVDQVRWGSPGARLFGKATFFAPAPEDSPEFDDGWLDNSAGASGNAEVSYFLRNGNLYRSVLLIRDPYLNPDSSLTQASPPGWPTSYPRFWNDFDYSACRWPTDATFATYESEFNGPASLSNDPTSLPLPPAYAPIGGNELLIHQSLGSPYLRFGHEFSAIGKPLEYRGTEFFGRFQLAERAGDLFAFPGTGVAPFDGTIPPDADNDKLYDFYSSGSPVRRGVDLMLPNVHAFDVEAWDDVLQQFVDIGYGDPSDPDEANPRYRGINPYTGNDQVGMFHASRRQKPNVKASLAPAEYELFDHPAITEGFGNRFDTWHPRMLIRDPSSGARWRNGRTPYRPRKTNPDPNSTGPIYPNGMSAIQSERAMPFGNERLDLDQDGLTILQGDAGETDAEAPLRAIRIKIRYIDPASGQLRQSTVEHSLID